MTQSNFDRKEKFGKTLEDSFIDTLKFTLGSEWAVYSGPNYLNCPNKYRDEDGHAIPDVVAVHKLTKEVRWYECKKKDHFYNITNVSNTCWTVDEKLDDSYRPFSKKRNEKVFIVFHTEDIGDTFHVINCSEAVNESRAMNNAHGKTMNVFDSSRCDVWGKKQKHNVNFTHEDVFAIQLEPNSNKKKDMLLALLENCTPERSNNPMKDEKIRYWKVKAQYTLRTNTQINNALTNIFFAGDKKTKTANDQGYKKQLSYS